MLRTWKTDTLAIRIPKYINMLVFSIEVVTIDYKQTNFVLYIYFLKEHYSTNISINSILYSIVQYV